MLTDKDGMHPGLSAEIKTQGKGGPAQRAWSTISSVLLPSAGPASLHCAFEQVTSSLYIGKPAAHSISLHSLPCFYSFIPHTSFLLQIYSHYNGVLVVPGWSRHFLLLPGA